MYFFFFITLTLFQNSVADETQFNKDSDTALWGQITEESSGAPLEAASVYLKYTMLGSATNEQGYYRIEGITPGTYVLVISRIGYTSHFQEIIIDGTETRLEINRTLQPAVYELGAIAIQAEPESTWKKHYDEFRKVFLATMPFEEEAEIVNPYGLEFRKEGRDLRAWNEEILIIENKALAYRIYFQLMGFIWNGRILEFSGAGFYEEQEVDDETIDANRSQMYSWLARSNPSQEGEWQARVMKGRCHCDLLWFGVVERGSCQCSYKGLTSPSFLGRFKDP